MLADTKIPVVLTERRAVGLDLSSRQQICVDTEDPYFGQGEQPCPVVAGGAERRTHILYTSGSTGKPKGIEILARGVSRLVLATNYVKFEPSDRVAQLANFSFDAAIFEVWGALLNGAAIVLIPRHVALDPHALQAELLERRVSVMFLTTALFNLVAQACPDALSRRASPHVPRS